ncbi:unnamed protein product [Diamesa tonsa]
MDHSDSVFKGSEIIVKTNKELLKLLINAVESKSNDSKNNLLSEILHSIFTNGLKDVDNKGTPNDLRRVFGVLDYPDTKSTDEQQKNFIKWLTNHIEKGKLSNLLSFLLSDIEHITNCYDDTSFIRTERYQNSLMLCILAWERNQLNLLTQIDLELYGDNKLKAHGHKRSSSQPHLTLSSPSTSFAASIRRPILAKMCKTSTNQLDVQSSYCLRAWHSLPNIKTETSIARPRSKTTHMRTSSWKALKKVKFMNNPTQTPQVNIPTVANSSEVVPYFDYRDSLNIATRTPNSSFASIHKVPIQIVNCDDIKIHTDYRYTPEFKKQSSTLSSNISPCSSVSSKSSFLLTPKRSLLSIFEGSHSASKIYEKEKLFSGSLSSSPTEIFFDFPQAGEKIKKQSPLSTPEIKKTRKIDRPSSRQNLTNFIHQIQKSRTKVELDRENAHFHLSEAIIATCEQLKWNRILNDKYKISKDLKTVKKIEDNSYKNRFKHPSNPDKKKFTVGSTDTDTESTTSDDLTSIKSKEFESSESFNENTPQLEWSDNSIEANSAEFIALSLISKFNDKHLPNPSNFLWLVSDSQVPQELLPMPDGSLPINPDEQYTLNTYIRGSKEWAPPRQQIIFTIHPAPDRKKLMAQQLNRCCGCGMKVAAAYFAKFRYCEYLGKYFCSGCHKFQISSIPGRVLEKWDYALYPVSVFAYRWLDQIWKLPLFRVIDLNPKLYEKVKQLSLARESRLQLKYLEDFISSCRFAIEEQAILQDLQDHWTEDVDIWSMNDFIDVKNNIFSTKVKTIIDHCEDHLTKTQCELCIARGFICENNKCPNKKEIIYPWQMKIKRCASCGSCYHVKCFTTDCSKCERIKKRQRNKLV